ncbi:MAG: carbon-nitrogen hydrolase family protein [Sedimentisphaerales bacterium]|nr:carbon-nitrogen hydrolase family protein [Sedimentisphaerales bacterium]
MGRGTLHIATCQFAVSSSITDNANFIRDFMQQAKEAKADIVHFAECALSGYAGTDFATFDGFDWGLLKSETKRIIFLAEKLNLWVVLGSSHRLTEPNKPYNSLYLISPEGQIVDRYDKRFCTGVDLENYTPGDRFVTFEINGVKCALLICFDLRFPELYRELVKLDVRCVIQSFYNARQKGPSVHSEIMRQTMQCRAATNSMWVSMANASGWLCPYPSCFIQPDGRIVKQLEDHRDDMMVNTVDINKEFYDPSEPFRKLAMDGVLTNGAGQIDDPRSKDKGCF